MGEPSDSRKKRRRGDVAEAISTYMQQNPGVDYSEILHDLHAKGYQLNRHGNSQLMALRPNAREGAGAKRRQ